METHTEVIPWLDGAYVSRGLVTVVRAGDTIQAGKILSGRWLSGEVLTADEIAKLNHWAATRWDMPLNT